MRLWPPRHTHFLTTAASALALALSGFACPNERSTSSNLANPAATTSGASPSQNNQDTSGALVASSEIRSVRVRTKTDNTLLVKQVDGAWILAEPINAPAHAEAIDGLLRALGALRLNRVLETNPALSALDRYGLNPPSFEIEVTSGDGTVTRFRGGKENAFDGSAALQKNSEPAVYQISGAFRFAADKTTFDLRAKNVLNVDATEILRLSLQAEKARWTISQLKPSQWVFEKRANHAVDSTAVQHLLNTLRTARALRFVEPSVHAGAKPLATLSIDLKTGPAVTLSFFNLHAADQGAVTIIRNTGAQPLAAVFEAGIVKALMATAGQLEDRSLLHFDSNAVDRIVFQNRQSVPLVLDREKTDGGVTSWMLTAPTRAAAKQVKLAALLWTLSHSKYESRGLNQKERRAVADESTLQTVLLFKQHQLAAKLVLGPTPVDSTESRVVRTLGDEVFLIDQSLFNDWPQTAADLTVSAPTSAGPIDAGT